MIRKKVMIERQKAIKSRKHLSANEIASKNPSPNSKSVAETGSQPAQTQNHSTPGLTNFAMFLHPDEKTLKKLSKELLRTPGRCPIWRMKRYVADRIEHTPYSDLDIYILPPIINEGDVIINSQAAGLRYSVDDGIALDDNETIDSAGKNFWDEMKGDSNLDLVLHYKLKYE
mmetsp:Transcript_10554/g.15823  ORF Transcript_10554/g.15823 Transcript_10554/m.15823 type:complete len:172 (+) Transcript_10554:44-559(+)